MGEESEKRFFNDDALRRMITAEGKEVKLVICYLWHNAVNKNDIVELIDNLELVFTDGSKLTFASDEDNAGLDVIDFNFEEQKAEVEKEFEGRIKLFAINASPTKMWKDIIGKKLVAVQLTKSEDKYLSDSVLLNFGDEKRTVTLSHLDGLIIDFYED